MEISEERQEMLEMMERAEAMVAALPESAKKKILTFVNKEMREVNERLFKISEEGGEETELISIFKEVQAYEAIKDIAINIRG